MFPNVDRIGGLAEAMYFLCRLPSPFDFRLRSGEMPCVHRRSPEKIALSHSDALLSVSVCTAFASGPRCMGHRTTEF